MLVPLRPDPRMMQIRMAALATRLVFVQHPGMFGGRYMVKDLVVVSSVRQIRREDFFNANAAAGRYHHQDNTPLNENKPPRSRENSVTSAPGYG